MVGGRDGYDLNQHSFNANIDLIQIYLQLKVKKLKKLRLFFKENKNKTNPDKAYFINKYISAKDNSQMITDAQECMIDDLNKGNFCDAKTIMERLPVISFFTSCSEIRKFNFVKVLSTFEDVLAAKDDCAGRFSYAAVLQSMSDVIKELGCIDAPQQYKSVRSLEEHLSHFFGDKPLNELMQLKCRAEWRHATASFFESPSVNQHLQSLGGTAYSILLENLGKVIVLKEGDKESLNEEKRLLDYIKNNVKYPFLTTVTPLLVVNHKDSCFLLELYNSGKNLRDAFYESKDYCLLRKTAFFLAQVHAFLPNEGALPDFIPYFQSFLRGFHLPGKIKQVLLDNMPVFLKLFYNAPAVFDRDAHPNNWYVSEGRIVLMDLAKRGVAPAEFDATKQFNCAKFFSHNKEGIALREQILLEDYLQPYNKFVSGDRIRGEFDFIFKFLHATPYRAISFYLRSQSIPEFRQYGLEFIDNAIQDIELLKEPRFSCKHSLAEMHQCEAVQKVLYSLRGF